MAIWWESLVFTLSVVAAVSVLVALLQRFAPPTDRERNNEIGTTLFELITVLYAVVLAFVLITAWENRNEAGHVTYQEADALVEVYWAAASLPEEERTATRAAVREYTELVVGEEWDSMSGLRPVDTDGVLLIDEMRAPLAANQPDDEVVQSRLDDARDQIRAVAEYRTDRLFQAQRGLSGSMWSVLLPGALLVLIVSLTLGTPTRRFQYVLVGLISGMVALMLFATYELEYPFSRGGAVGPDAFETALERFDEIDAHYTDL
ncbi:bestrophin-like domain [Glycomyces tarimensis]